MPTKLLYLANSQQKSDNAHVIGIDTTGKQTVVYLDQTIFYPQGGGQQADRGTIKGPHGQLEVTHVSYNGGDVQHKGVLTGSLHEQDPVTLSIDWDHRHRNMQLHTAGHVVDQAVKNVIPDASSIDGMHGIDNKLYIEFTTQIPASSLSAIQQEVENILSSSLPIQTEMVTRDELLARQIKLPFDLPSDKPLRIMQIGNYPPMPDGSTQLINTKDCWPISVTNVESKNENWRVHYTVTNPLDSKEEHTTVHSSKDQPNRTIQGEMEINHLHQAISIVSQDFEHDLTTLPLPQLQIKYLGKKGAFNDLAKIIPQLSAQDRKAAGQLINQLKQKLETKLNELSQNYATAEWVDLTVPGTKPKLGHVHPVSQAIAEITQIFQKIGFTLVRYPEVDWDWYVFESLNMPKNHPARDEWETFFVEAPVHPEKGKMVLTAHTSNGQVREMERLKSKPPIRMINMSRCYRRQQDATHTQMFHQFEGLVVDKGINIQHLKGTLDYFAQEFYGPGTKSRIRPFHFQFTEPSFEVDFSCHICHGTGYLEHDKTDSNSGETNSDTQLTRAKCKFCKSGWHEVGGAGMVHPNVLKAGGIDPNEYTGFAFGWGIERTYTLKEGLKIDDIRLLYSGEFQFLEQF